MRNTFILNGRGRALDQIVQESWSAQDVQEGTCAKDGSLPFAGEEHEADVVSHQDLQIYLRRRLELPSAPSSPSSPLQRACCYRLQHNSIASMVVTAAHETGGSRFMNPKCIFFGFASTGAETR
jgi:hypothetical protein